MDKIAPGASSVNEIGISGFLRSAQMVHPLADKGVGEPASFVARNFHLAQPSGKETLRISALGLYRCFINGHRVGDDLLTPGWTAYDKRLAYQTYDVSDLLVAGDNRIEIWLADGWYRSQLLWRQQAIFNVWGKDLAAIAELRSGPAPDAAIVVCTDADWESGVLPIRKSGIYFGEVYDARREALTADTGVVVLDFDPSVLIAQEAEPVHELEPLRVAKSWKDEAGRIIYDFAQNCGGYVAFRVTGQAGAKVVVEHAEILDGAGKFENTNYRTADARIEYTLKGGAEESYRPHFTFQGFRYARVTIEGTAEITHIESVPISSAQHRTGWFESSSALVNRLVENTVWSQRSNFIDVPTDCPQRDERLGWTGDAQVFAGTSCYLFESQTFWRKWLRDLMADQRENGEIPHFSPDPTRQNSSTFPNAFGSTGWGDAICVIPWVLYEQYGDTEVLEETLPAMERWVDYVWSISDGPLVNPNAWGESGFSFGDWLQPKGTSVKPLPTIGDDAAATIYLYIASDLTAKAAEIVGRTDLASRMRQRANEVKKAFAAEYITETGRVGYNDQTSYALAIIHDLIPANLLPQAVERFRDAIVRCNGRIGTGFIGTPALLPALTKVGEYELAARLFLQEEVPGWLYQVKNGATTIWERWDAVQPDGSLFDPGMNSFNHYAYGAVCQWLFESVAGIRPDPEDPGFKHVILEPAFLPELSPVSARHDSPAGPIETSWTMTGNTVAYAVDLPAGSRSTLVLREKPESITCDGKSVTLLEEGERFLLPLDPGSHALEIEFRRVPGTELRFFASLPEPSV